MRHWISAIMLVSGIFLFQGVSNASITVNVVDRDGVAIDMGANPDFGFRWLLEEDNTHPSIPDQHVIPGAVVSGSDPEDGGPGSPAGAKNNLSMSLHRSHAPVVKSGRVDSGNSVVIDTLSDDTTALPGRRYMVSVLPTSGDYTVGGSNVAFQTGGSATVDVLVIPSTIPTAQISVLVFEDISPTNNAQDAGEPGLEGFAVRIFDDGGQMVLNALGHPIGTTYMGEGDIGCTPEAGDIYCLDPEGTPIPKVLGQGFEVTGPDGIVLVKNLAPGKYGVHIIPTVILDEFGEPVVDANGLAVRWHQTTTIEGSPAIDAWVRSNEPSRFVEAGPPGFHAFFGFTKTFNNLPTTGGRTVTGQVRRGHSARPPFVTFSDGPAPETTNCLIALNDAVVGGTEDAQVVMQCDEEGFFTINNVPVGSYTLVVWDQFLDHIIEASVLNVTALSPPTIELGTLASRMWFGEQNHVVFFDTDEDGFRDPGELGMPEQNVLLRWRDGTVYKAMPTDLMGESPFEEVFPFFFWQVAEVDFTRYKATGLTTVIDDGGIIPDDASLPQGLGYQDPATPFADGIRNPVTNLYTNNPYFTDQGPVLTQAFQSFAGTNVRFEWGKSLYDVGENGGISGVVFYATTRAEDDPRFAAGEEWEPGVPRVQVNLYEDFDNNEIPDDLDSSGDFTKADVDNYPLGWSDGGAKSVGDVDWNSDGNFDQGDASRVTWTDSWDDSLPEDCVGSAPPAVLHDVDLPISHCAEGMRTWAQARPGVFDGGYAFGPNVTGDGSPELAAGTYIVETATPPGYELLKEEDKNVDFGLAYEPSPLLLPATCVGDDHIVPAELTLFPGIEAPYAGEPRPLCDRKRVTLVDRQNAAADFFLFTYVPKASRMVGFTANDVANEFDPNRPAFQEKFTPAWLPVSVRDYSGQEIVRFYTDEFGKYNALVPSSYSIDVPSPTGVSPAMHNFCVNHPGPIDNPDFGTVAGAPEFITDPHYMSQYITFCYTFEFYPAKTRYLDTPVLSNAAFVGASQESVDCECATDTPAIRQVIGASGLPAYLPTTGGIVTITSMGVVDVPNPGYPGAMDPPIVPKTIPRDYGFGSDGLGVVTIGDFTVHPANITWTDGVIELDFTGGIPAGLTTGQLMITKSNGVQSKAGLTLNVVNVATEGSPFVVGPPGSGEAYESIQDGIDAASSTPNALVLVKPGYYHENVFVYKSIRLQGSGSASTVIDAIQAPQDAAIAARAKFLELNGAGLLGILPGQDIQLEIQSGISVMPVDGEFNAVSPSRIDGFTVRAANNAGIFVNAYGRDMSISNNLVTANNGWFGGGIRVGYPTTTNNIDVDIVTSPNENITIHHNRVLFNGSFQNGGGIAVHDGADNYVIRDNLICGNRTNWGGAGIAHVGQSLDGTIVNNTVIFNEQFQGDTIGAGAGGNGGGGIDIYGEPAAALGETTIGTGSVKIINNVIQGNLSGAGDGGGINLRFINGTDVEASTNPDDWFGIEIYNNIIAHNVAALAGGGIGIFDAAKVSIVHNTIAHNDSTATGALAFPAGDVLERSTPHPAGISSRMHSLSLAFALPLGESAFSDPTLVNNIVYQNRSFFWWANLDPAGNQLAPLGDHPNFDANDVYWDLGVVDGAIGVQMEPTYSLLTALIGPDGALYWPLTGVVTGDPEFAAGLHFNTLLTGTEPEEGGNFIQTLLNPLSLWDPMTGALLGDYHLTGGSPAGASGVVLTFPPAELTVDMDGDPRFMGNGPEIGADELDASIQPSNVDTDGDGVFDSADNCTEIANADQRDTNNDGYGNLCDADLNNDGNVNFADLGVFKNAFFSSGPGLDADLNGDGQVNFGDLGIMRGSFFSAPGPSGTTP